MLTKISKLPATGRQLMAIEQAKQKNKAKQDVEERMHEDSKQKDAMVKMKHKKIYEDTIKSRKMELLPVELQPLSATKKDTIRDKAANMNIVNYWTDLDEEQQNMVKSVMEKYRRPFKLLMKK